MVDQVGLVIQGDEKKNTLTVDVVHESNGDLSIYNIIHAGDGNDSLSGRPASDSDVIEQYGVQLFGEDGNDALTDSLGDDTLSGGIGNDYLLSGYGHDIIDGGAGIDSLTIARNTVLASETLVISGVERLQLSGQIKIGDFDLGQFDLITHSFSTTVTFTEQTNLEGVNFGGNSGWRLTGSKFADSFDFSASTGEITLLGGAGDDIVVGAKEASNIDGESGNDRITGSSEGDGLSGGTGDDVIFGGDGKDSISDSDGHNTLHGGAGADTFAITGGIDRIFGDDGNDRIVLSNGSFMVDAGDDDDEVYLNGSKANGNWTLHGGEGTDILHPSMHDLSHLKVDGFETLSLYDSAFSIGADALDSFDRIDVYRFSGFRIQLSSGGDLTWKHSRQEESSFAKLNGSEETDRIDMSASTSYWTITGRGGDDIIIGGRGRDIIDGGDGDDTLTERGGGTVYGGNGNDIVTGGKSDEVLYGNDGNDFLVGSDGYDRMWGQDGADTYIFKNGNDGGAEILHYDHVGNDRDIIDLSAVKSIKNFDDMLKNHLDTSDFFKVGIYFGGYEIILGDTKVKDLDESAFIF